MMQKKLVRWHGGYHYLLGKNENGEQVYLVKESWNCDWYWGFGYLVTFTNDSDPEKSKDYKIWTHVSSKFFNNKDCWDAWNKYFTERVLSDKESWTFLELMRTFYHLQTYARVARYGSSDIATNPCGWIIKHPLEADRINKEVMPAIFKEVEKLLS